MSTAFDADRGTEHRVVAPDHQRITDVLADRSRKRGSRWTAVNRVALFRGGGCARAASAALLDRVQSRVDGLTASPRRESRDSAAGALGPRPKDVTVTDEGLRLALTGDAATPGGSGS
ncbi:hypothetical protein [Streptomyces sp. NPDC017202]|uniref:hypothetical protein n=1 Tax=Streptomyces sp. NPDC017202 TaxID=3364981 RepID=UPI00379E59EF